MAAARLYDGASGVGHEVTVEPDGAGLRIGYADGSDEYIAGTALETVDRRPDGLILGRPGVEGWRLRIGALVPPAIADLFPKRDGYGRWIDRIGLWRAAALFAAASSAVVAAGYVAPWLLAPLVPASVERAYGEALVGDFGGKFCKNPAGQRALAKLTARLAPDTRDIRIRVVDVPLVNAAALPAGNIVVFDQLLSTVQSPDELAGVLAHEITHVRKRHVTAGLIRQFGIGLIASTLGGTTGGNVDSVVALRFTRGAEHEADEGAIAMLNQAHISPRPTAAFFARLTKEERTIGRFEPAIAYLSSHPLSADRERLFFDGARTDAPYTPALDAKDWSDLRGICLDRGSRN